MGLDVTETGWFDVAVDVKGPSGARRWLRSGVRALTERPIGAQTITEFGTTIGSDEAATFGSGAIVGVPDDAVSAPTALTLAELDGMPAEMHAPMGAQVPAVFAFGPSGVGFAAPLRFVLPIANFAPDACGATPNVPSAELWGTGAKAAEPLDITLDCNAKTLAVNVQHFSLLDYFFNVYCDAVGDDGTLCKLWDGISFVNGQKIDAADVYGVKTELPSLTSADLKKLYALPLNQINPKVDSATPLSQYLFAEHISDQAWQALHSSSATRRQDAMKILGISGDLPHLEAFKGYVDALKSIAPTTLEMKAVFVALDGYTEVLFDAVHQIQSIGWYTQYVVFDKCRSESGTAGGSSFAAAWTPDPLTSEELGTFVTDPSSDPECQRIDNGAGWFDVPKPADFSPKDINNVFRAFELIRRLEAVPQEEWTTRRAYDANLILAAAQKIGVPGVKLCSNGQVDIGEICDGDFVKCSTIMGTSSWGSTAFCAPDCSGYDTSTCLHCVEGESCDLLASKCHKAVWSCSGDYGNWTCDDTAPLADGVPCGSGQICSQGACGAGAPIPGTPAIGPPASATAGNPAAVILTAGADLGGAGVKIVYASDGSSCPTSSPCETALGSAGDVFTPELTWSSAGTKMIAARSVAKGGVKSAINSVQFTVLPSLSSGTGGAGGGGANSSSASGAGGGSMSSGSGGCGQDAGACSQSIVAGQDHSCGLRLDGTAKCWGWNYNGQLGDGTLADKVSPVVVTGLSNAIDLTAGDLHTCALLTDGTARCWGRNYEGQLGDGTQVNKYTPVTVSGLSTVVALSGGGQHTCALLADGTARCWGRNLEGQLGDGTQVNSYLPVTVSGLSNAIALAAGGLHTCALITDGSVRCWGSNSYGCLGDGTTVMKLTPVVVSGLLNATALVAGKNDYTCARLTDGTGRCWGRNFEGQLGDGTLVSKSTSVAVLGLSNAIALVAGSYHTCSLLADGTAQCWGSNSYGKLGDGTTVDKYTPALVSGLSNVVSLAAGMWHTCARLTNGTARCWGNNAMGNLGDGTMVDEAAPVSVLAFP